MLETPIDQPPAPVGKKSTAFKAERLRGLNDGRAQIEVLKAKWPAIFNDLKDVRPLASSVLPQVAAALNWSCGYARGVFQVWKGRSAYCRAILYHSVRVNLDGSASEETVDDRARKMAKAQLDRMAARKAMKAAPSPAEAEKLILSERDSLRVLDLLDDHPEPPARLIHAAQAEKRRAVLAELAAHDQELGLE